jgi:hypothetical protein
MTDSNHHALSPAASDSRGPCEGSLESADLRKARLLHAHGLNDAAKNVLIEVICGKEEVGLKAAAMNLLGSIAFSQGQVTLALDTWREMIVLYPASPDAQEVRERLKEFADVIGETTKQGSLNATAEAYLRHGDFWCKRADRIFTIDTSFIPSVEASVKWYNRVIADFPGTEASQVAHVRRLRALFGWEETGAYGSKAGLKEDFDKYMPHVIKAFHQFEEQHPDAPPLQAFRYQIAQAYWRRKSWKEAKEWLVAIEKHGDASDTFYVDLARRRHQFLEW